MEWFNLIEETRIKEVYSIYSIEQFWDWWSDKKQQWMEIRTITFDTAKYIGQTLKIKFYHGGVFVNNYIDLKNVIIMARRLNTTIWCSANPRKYNYNKWGNKSLNGTDPFIRGIKFLFIDIDRQVKQTQATLDELKNCDIVSNLILDKLKEQGWNKNYIKICSGNGVQLLIKLDYELVMPNADFDAEHKGYTFNDEFKKYKMLVSETIGKQIIQFVHKKRKELNNKSYCDVYNVDIDKTAFRIGQVSALPFTKNFKFNAFTWRGIIEIIDEGKNEGMSDYILNMRDEVIIQKQQKMEQKKFNKYKIKKGTLLENKLVRFMLDNNLPVGSRNNYIWFSLVCLMRDSGLDFASEEVRKMYHLVVSKYDSGFKLIIPKQEYVFNPDTVNKYCIMNLYPPLYDLWEGRYVDEKFNLDNLKWEHLYTVNNKIQLPIAADIFEDMKTIKQQLEIGSFDNVRKIYEFTLGCIDKYGEEKTKYYFTYLFKRYIGYS